MTWPFVILNWSGRFIARRSSHNSGTWGQLMIDGMAINQHAHVDAAHAVTRGAGTTIAVIDDGFDIDHVEFSAAGKIVAPFDALSRSRDPRPRDHHPRFPDNHGTACAGVACAAGLDGATGVAPDARLMPIRFAANLGSMAEARAFKWAADNGADVISCSWGPPDGDWDDPDDPRHDVRVPLPDSSRDAMNYAITNGRGGRGCVILFAAGNGNESVSNDGYASHDQTIAVAACNDRGRRSVYSDFGPELWCSFPSNDFGFPPTGHPAPLTPGIWTADRSGRAGYNRGRPGAGDTEGDYTNSFGGTSSACPGAAGVCALILSVNPELGWQDVREILRKSAERIDPGEGNYDAAGHSRFYGYGRVNAAAAVQLARGEVRSTIEVSRSFARPIEDLGTTEVTLTVTDDEVIEDLAVSVKIDHSYVGDLVLSLIPPGRPARTVELQSRRGGSRDDLERTYRSSSHDDLAQLLGRSSAGTWTLRVQDRAARDVGVIRRFGLHIGIGSDPARRSMKGGGERRAAKRQAGKKPPVKRKPRRSPAPKTKARAKSRGGRKRARKPAKK